MGSKKIEKIPFELSGQWEAWIDKSLGISYYDRLDYWDEENLRGSVDAKVKVLAHKPNEVIDELNKLKK